MQAFTRQSYRYKTCFGIRLAYNTGMKPRVYVETSVISYLTARPSRDLVMAAHQEVTRELPMHRAPSKYAKCVNRLAKSALCCAPRLNYWRSTDMLNDSIVEEIHAARAQLLSQHGGHLAAYFAALLQKQEQHPERYASFIHSEAVEPSVDRPQAG